MAVPWLRLLDIALGVTNLAQLRSAREDDAREPSAHRPGSSLAGVVAAALREVLERDARKMQLLREKAEADRQRAERALKVDLLRRAADREAVRQRTIAACAVAGWIGSIVAAIWLIGDGTAARVLIGGGLVLQIAAVAASFLAHSRLGDPLDLLAAADGLGQRTRKSAGLDVALWLLVMSLALIGIAAIL